MRKGICESELSAEKIKVLQQSSDIRMKVSPRRLTLELLLFVCICPFVFVYFVDGAATTTCYPTNDVELETCLEQDSNLNGFHGNIILQSDKTYHLNVIDKVINNTYIIDNLFMNSSSVLPARLKLGKLPESTGLFTGGKVELDNIYIEAEECENIFLHSLNETVIKNSKVSHYHIKSVDTKFISLGKRVHLSNTTFYNNTIGTTDSSGVDPACMIGTNFFPDWDFSISECTFLDNRMKASHLPNVVNLFFNFWAYEKEVLSVNLNILQSHFSNNIIEGPGSAFGWIAVSQEYGDPPENSFTITSSSFTDNQLLEYKVKGLRCGLEYGLFCASFFSFFQSLHLGRLFNQF